MKSLQLIVLVIAAQTVDSARLTRTASPVSNVVNLLETMLEKSKADGDQDRELYAKYKCYCDNEKETKTGEIEQLTTDISLLENKIEELRASNGELSTQVAELKESIAEKDRQIDQANHLQQERETAWYALRDDLTRSIASMKEAIGVLAEVGADQTLEEGSHTAAADHTKFMAGYKASSLRSGSLLKMSSVVKQALVAAQAFLPADKKAPVQSFLQAPFTGTYTSQSTEVMGILKNMRDTFQANYATAETTFNQQTKAHLALVGELQNARELMDTSMKSKQQALGVNDGSLATKKQALSGAKTSKQSKQDFLDELIPSCEKKAKEFDERNTLRANEDAAITQAIAILNKDSAFHAFKKTDATSFVQLSSHQRQHHSVFVADPSLKRAQQVLLRAAQGSAVESLGLKKIAALIEANNPFEVVLQEITKMIGLIQAEGQNDKQTLDWCKKERIDANNVKDEKERQIIALNGEITELTNDIEAPIYGLRATVAKIEEYLQEIATRMKTETSNRVEANKVYQENIANQVEAQRLLSSAINVLKEYYSQFSLAQTGQPEEVQTGPWADGYSGQSVNGNAVIEQLEFILKSSKEEEAATHTAEQEDQHEFEDSMQWLKSDEINEQKNLASVQLSLAETEKTLGETKADLKKTEAALEAVKQYLLEIKPGCDFITTNFDEREAHRAAETTGLTGARAQLKGSPAYMTYEAQQHLEDLGDCQEVCVAEGQKNAKCLACLNKVTVPGYCAGHPGTDGC